MRDQSTSKRCRKCGEDKPIGEFYASKGMRDGRMNTCKACHLQRTQAWAQRNPDSTSGYGRGRYRRQRSERIAQMDRTCDYCEAAIPDDRAAHARYCSRECTLGAQEARRRERVRLGRLGRTCEYCGDPISTGRSTKATTCSVKCRNALNEAKLMRIKCRQLSLYAVKTGRLVKQPCEVCGSEEVEIHHTDYFDPINVRWLCFVHHRNLMHGTAIPEAA